MELTSYLDEIKGLTVQELKDCGWIDLITVPIEDGFKASAQDIQTAIESLHAMFYKAEKLELSTQGIQLCIRNLSQGARTFRVCASKSSTEYDPPKLRVMPPIFKKLRGD